MAEPPETALASAMALQQAGKADQAEAAHRTLLERYPGSLASLQFLSARAMGRGDYVQAVDLIRRYLTLRPDDRQALEALGRALEEAGREAEAATAFGHMLKTNPRDAKALFLLGGALERAGESAPAAAAAAILESTAPGYLSLDDHPSALDLHRQRSRRLAAALSAYRSGIRSRSVDASEARHGDAAARRLRHAFWRPREADFGGDRRRPKTFFIPDLPDRPWFERDAFDWVPELEARAEGLAREVAATFDPDRDAAPYIADHLGKSAQWAALAGNVDWGALHFFNAGRKNEEALARFPLLRDALEHLPLLQIGGAPVEVLLSVLKPRTEIPPHYGIANHRLTVHLPLIVPVGCGVKVAGEARETQAGRTMVFDDSYEHSAWNHSDAVRIVLIFEIWNPDLSPAEREATTIMLEEFAAFEGERRNLVALPMENQDARAVAARARLERSPDDRRAWLDLTDALIRLGRREDAAQVASLGIDRRPELLLIAHAPRTAAVERYLSQRLDRVYRDRMVRLHRDAVGVDGPQRILDAVWPQTHNEPVRYQAEAQRPHVFYVPDLPPRPVFSREALPWAETLESHTLAIREELMAAIDLDRDGEPYLHEGLPLGPEWSTLKGSRRWTSLHLYKDGVACEEIRARFPKTVAAVKETTVTRMGGEPIEVFFSILRPKTHIPPHFGLANSRLTVHLPLLVPEDCAIRVADHTHVWREGRVFAFDDSFDHEAWNDSDRIRIVLIFEVWHPDLIADEIAGIERSFRARDAWLKARRVPRFEPRGAERGHRG